MHKKFDHVKIETKWQEKWKADGIYNAGARDQKKEKEYVLVEWPYPSGNLHIGHWFAFAVTDIYVRWRRMQGRQVIFPMGFDAFGLPAENAAIKNNLDPKEWTEKNVAYMKDQLNQMGNSFNWDFTTSSTDPDYYKWTQWMFNQFFKNDIAYRGMGIVNWCPSCNTVLANEQVINELCERCETPVEKKEMEEWKMRITKYADRLIDDLDKLNWPEHIKESQRQWIGRREGSELTFKLSTGDDLSVFTTRADTLYGATYMVLAPEHELIQKNKDSITNWEEVLQYIEVSSKKSEMDRMNDAKEKTGVQLEGITATNPGNGEEIPVYIADYVLVAYGTGAIMGVPAHDERDYAFAKKYTIPIKQVIVPCFLDPDNPPIDGREDVPRNIVIVFVRNKETNEFVLLQWHGKMEGTVSGVMGGIESGETPEETTRREIAEEIGCRNPTLVKELKWITDAKFFAAHKDENRHAQARAFMYEIESLDGQVDISPEELKMHTPVWVAKDKVRSMLNIVHQQFLWDQISDETPLIFDGSLINSDEFDGMDSEEAKRAITEKVGGKVTNTYRLRDWSVGRQRYWGVPVPIVYDPEGKPHAIKERHLPWHLPTDVDFKPTGEAPLAKSKELKERVVKIYGEGWTPAVETLDTFVDSAWYFMRYIDNRNKNEFSSKEMQTDWMPVDLYFGGAEHTTMHLLYSRFWQKALYDLGLAVHEEPYKRRINRGLVLGPDGNKMSKSKGNVIDPDQEVVRLGADSVKMYLAFMGPYGEMTNYPWDMGGITGLRRFLERVYGLQAHIQTSELKETTKLLHKTILKVSHDIEAFKFNTAISSMMIFLNRVEKEGLLKESYETFLRLLAPFAPHLSEELWHDCGYEKSIHLVEWPEASAELAKDEVIEIGVQINGKKRGSILLSMEATEEEAVEIATSDAHISARLTGKIAKTIYVPGRILNIIQRE